MSAFEDPEIGRRLLESLQVGVCVVDLQKRIIFWSDGAERITGNLRHEVVGRHCRGDLFCNAIRTLVKPVARNVPLGPRSKAHPSQTEGYLHHKPGHRVPVQVWTVPVRDAHGSMIGVLQSYEARDHTIASEGNVGNIRGTAGPFRRPAPQAEGL
jgi:PAS domain S-box-containing protein